MKIYLYIFVILFICVDISNAETGIGYSFFTYHINQKDHYNENNHGIMISVDNVFVSTFNNSHYNRSWFGGYSFRTKKKGEDFWFRMNLHVGALYGYEDDMPNFEGWTVGVVPTVEFGLKKVALETMLSPAQDGVLACMIKFYF